MRNWLLPLLFFAGFACNKSNDPDPAPIPEQPQQELNGWQKITTNTNDNFADIAFTTPAVGYLAGANGVYKSADSGKTWVSEPTITTRPVTINFMDQQYGYAVGQVSMQITRNGGSDWQRKQLTISNQAIDVCFISPAIGYLALQYGKILKTVDTGNTWQPIANFSNRECLSVFFLNEQQGWYAVKDSVYRTVNGGTSWSGQKLSNSSVFTVFFTDASNGWATADSSVYRTIDGGNNWSKKVVTSSTIDIQFLNSQVGYVSVYDGVFKTTDGGTTWTRHLTAPLNAFPELLFLNENTGWVTGGGNIIYRWKK